MSRIAKSVFFVFALALWPLAPAWSQPVSSRGQDPLSGSRVFGTKGCAGCHAVNGLGGKVGPDLGRVQRPRSFYDLAAAMWNHLPRMVAQMQQHGVARPQLSTQETADLIAFFYALHYFDAPGDPQAGQRYFSEKRCVVCHQVRGTGGVVGPNLDLFKPHGTAIFVAAALWNHSREMMEAMKERGIERPAFTGRELRDLIAFLAGTSGMPAEGPVYVLPGRADSGQRLFVERRCIMCHRAGASGGWLGPDLAERGVQRSLLEFAAAMWNKAPAMTAAMKAQGTSVPQLRPEDMADILAYLYSIRYFADPGNSGNGRALVREKGCLRCHGQVAERAKVAPGLEGSKRMDSPSAVIAALWNHPVIVKTGEKATWPEFRPEEMADLVALLQSIGWRQ